MKYILCYFLLIAFISCTSQKDRDEYIGEYKINIRLTEWGSIRDSFMYEDIKLSIFSNDSFRLSRPVVFIASIKGTWQVRSIDGIPWAYFKYESSDYKIAEDQVGITREQNLYINNPTPIKGKESVTRLIFSRIK